MEFWIKVYWAQSVACRERSTGKAMLIRAWSESITGPSIFPSKPFCKTHSVPSQVSQFDRPCVAKYVNELGRHRPFRIHKLPARAHEIISSPLPLTTLSWFGSRLLVTKVVSKSSSICSSKITLPSFKFPTRALVSPRSTTSPRSESFFNKAGILSTMSFLSSNASLDKVPEGGK